MRYFSRLALVLLTFSASFGQELPQTTQKEPSIPTIEACIPEKIKKLPAPGVFPFQNGIEMAITAASELAQIHTLQGLNHLHGGWEIEAMRHFAFVLKEDPECLMAHWGMAMAMLNSSPETQQQKVAASFRMVELISQGKGTALELAYCNGLMQYIQKGPASASAIFQKISEQFPNELQAHIFTSLFGRTGYDIFGKSTYNQQVAEDQLTSLIQKHPENTLPLHAYLLIKAEAPDLHDSLELARRLCILAPDYAPYFHVLGHYEWRCGEHSKAVAAFSRASTLFSAWMKENNVTPADCEAWIKAECYRAVSLASKGDFENALAAAEKISKTKINPERLTATGTKILLWNAKTLPARILMRRGKAGDYALALESLPKPDEGKPFHKASLSYWWVDGLRIALEAHRLVEKTDIGLARQTSSALTLHGSAMSQRQAIASAMGEASELRSSFLALEMLASELNARITLAGPTSGHGSAFNWLRSAVDKQRPTSMLNPPLVLTPMAMRLGDFYIKTNQPPKAIESYEEALKLFPKDMETEIKLAKAHELSTSKD